MNELNNKTIEKLKGMKDNTKQSVEKEKLEFNRVVAILSKITTSVYDNRKYVVSLDCQEKNSGELHGNIIFKEFNDKNEADIYYNDLKSRLNEEYISNILSKSKS